MQDKISPVGAKKIEIRKELGRRLKEQQAFLRLERSKAIQEKFLSSKEFNESTTVMTYASLPTEVDTYYINKEALKRGKRVVVPYVELTTQMIIASEIKEIEWLEKGPFGIYQPPKVRVQEIPLKEIDLIVVPAIAFDKKNQRLGRGKGYYDRFLASSDLSSAKTIGLAFKFQIVENLPSDLHDIPVDRVITD
ncbi:MAG: 5-formyltetrahydrofolate cyclo-ligase [Candidatus Omnitrophota bacterium]